MKTNQNLTILILLFFFNLGFSQSNNGKIPFYAQPYYNSEPLTITIGKYKKELLTNNVNELKKVEQKIKKNINDTDIESLYILSIRLYDLKQKDDAFYWFQTAKSRARIFINMLDKEKIGGIGSIAFETKQFFNSCNQLVGVYINGYGFNDLEKCIAIYEKVQSEVKTIQSYKNVYPNINFIEDTNIENEKLKKEKELQEGITYVKENKAKIMQQRKDNGIQDKY
ncbi:MAG: hypothetical protein V4497_09225 [Bacteroidota bacterium]